LWFNRAPWSEKLGHHCYLEILSQQVADKGQLLSSFDASVATAMTGAALQALDLKRIQKDQIIGTEN
jgi:hypothetical protein